MNENTIASANPSRLQDALVRTRSLLLSLRNAEGTWTGELSASALSTATAVVALGLVPSESRSEPRLRQCIEEGIRWLVSHANADGGWGDTIRSHSNISTTTLVWAALGTAVDSSGSTVIERALSGAEQWLRHNAGALEPEVLAAKIMERYGSDRTFSAPILTHCALSGRLGKGAQAWRQVIPLPFEFAAFPPAFYGALRLPVVSYALPALIAVGYARHYHAPSRNPLIRFIRSLVAQRVLQVLESVQPSNGGFLEATPLTGFVVMSLAGSGKGDHPVTRRGLEFLLNSAQPDGSWRIDTNLSTFVTTLATHALTSGSSNPLPETERLAIQQSLLRQQYRVRHPYTNAASGGWAWTPLPGGVPDADDTAAALLALRALQLPAEMVIEAVQHGVTWLLNLQNRDGGIPTFCRGWGKLPFDRSSADLTAHALRAWAAWEIQLPGALRVRIRSATHRAVRFLRRAQESNGSWAPLWFGNQFEPDEANRVYGTSRVLLALAETGLAPDCARNAIEWLARVQKPDGGWSGGASPAPSSTEETALAVEALSAAQERQTDFGTGFDATIQRGVENLLQRVETGRWTEPAPIGFYFAKLWYYEKLYPVIFTVAALERAGRCRTALAHGGAESHPVGAPGSPTPFTRPAGPG